MEKEAVFQWVQDIQSTSLDPVETYGGYFNPDIHHVASSKSTSAFSPIHHTSLHIPHPTTSTNTTTSPSFLHKPQSQKPPPPPPPPNSAGLLSNKSRPLPIQIIKPSHIKTSTGPRLAPLSKRHVVNLSPFRSSFSMNSMDSPIPLSNPEMVLPTITLTHNRESIIPRRKPLIKRSVSNAQKIHSRNSMHLSRSSTSPECDHLSGIHKKYIPKSVPVSPQLQNRSSEFGYRTSVRECISQEDIRALPSDRKRDNSSSGFDSIDSTRRSGSNVDSNIRSVSVVNSSRSVSVVNSSRRGSDVDSNGKSRSDVAEKHSLSEHSSDDLEMPLYHSEANIVSDGSTDSVPAPAVNTLHQELSLLAVVPSNVNRGVDATVLNETDVRLEEECRDTGAKEEDCEGNSDPDVGTEPCDMEAKEGDHTHHQGDPHHRRDSTHHQKDHTHHEEDLLKIMKKWYYQGYGEKDDLVQALKLTGHRLSAEKLILENSDTIPWVTQQPDVQNDTDILNNSLKPISSHSPKASSPISRFALTKQKAVDRSPSPSDPVVHDTISPEVTSKKKLLRKTQTFSFDTSDEVDVTQLPKQPKFLSKKNPLKRSFSVQQDASGSNRISSSSRNNYSISSLGVSHVTSHDAYLNKGSLNSPTFEDQRKGGSPVRMNFNSPTFEDRRRGSNSPIGRGSTLEDHRRGSSPIRRSFNSPTFEDPGRGSSPNSLGHTKAIPLSSLIRNDQLNTEHDKARQRLLEKHSSFPNFIMQHRRIGSSGAEEQYTGHNNSTYKLAVGSTGPGAEIAKPSIQNLSSINLYSKGWEERGNSATRQDSGIGTLSLTSDELKHML